jgi:galactokinase
MISSEIKQKFIGYFGPGHEPEAFFSPGRVNIIGEHLDYNGGAVFPAALSLGITALIRKNSGKTIRMRSMNFDNEVTIDLSREITPQPERGWGNYPAGVISFLIRDGFEIGGFDILYASTLPEGAGLSSSACIEVLTGYMLTDGYFDSEEKRVDLAVLCRKVENEFIGVQCGIMDQFAVAMGKRDHAVLLDSSALSYRYISLLLSGYSLVIMNTNKPRRLAESKFNERQAECAEALRLIKASRKISMLTEACQDDLEVITDPVIRKRALHVISENARVAESVALLSAGNIEKFGNIMNASHRSLRYNYEVTGPELDAITDAALDTGLCAGARMTGAGFGGCAIALVKRESFEEFAEMTGRTYTAITGLKADFYKAEISDGVKKIM